MHFEKIRISDIRKETADCVSISFDIPAALKDYFSFKQGQYLTLKKEINGVSIRRSYSICSSPLDNELRIAVKKTPHGIFSTYANEVLKIGDEIELMPPAGKFYTELNPSNENNYVAITAGSGITPILSIIKTTLLTEPKSSFTLVFGNRNRYSILFKEELESLKNKYLARFRIIYILSREKTETDINFGRIDESKCKALFDKIIDPAKTSAFFLCGPEEMVFTVKTFLEEIGVKKNKIHFELFTTANKSSILKPIINLGQGTLVKSKIIVTLDSITFQFDLAFNGESILNAALAHGVDVPFACKAGVCCTCKAKLIEGEVEMDVVYGLEPYEIDQGFILTCQSHPRTEKVVIDFDSR